MKIAIPVRSRRGLRSEVVDFASAPFVALVETTTHDVEFISAPSRNGHRPTYRQQVRALKEFGIEAVVCRGFNQHALGALWDEDVCAMAPALDDDHTINDALVALHEGDAECMEPEPRPARRKGRLAHV